VTVRAIGNFAVRFLWIDAPEESFPLPGSDDFVSIGDAKWQAFLNDPFADMLPPFKPALTKGLLEHLTAHVGSGTAANHAKHSGGMVRSPPCPRNAGLRSDQTKAADARRLDDATREAQHDLGRDLAR
jgi:hypothetical protein